MAKFNPKELKTLSDILALILDEEAGQSSSALEAIKARARRNKTTGGALKNLFHAITADPTWSGTGKNPEEEKTEKPDKTEEYLARINQVSAALNEANTELTATRNYTHRLHDQLQYALSLQKETEVELREQIVKKRYPSLVMIFAIFGAGVTIGIAFSEITHVLTHVVHSTTNNAQYLY